MSADRVIMVRESEWREMREALEACLRLEQEKAKRFGYSDCCCMSWSRATENAYERGACPHQMARAALAHPTPDGCGREGRQIEAAARAIADAWGETWECCCTEQRGLDCDCGDAMSDEREKYDERLSREDCRMAARAALSALTAGGVDG